MMSAVHANLTHQMIAHIGKNALDTQPRRFELTAAQFCAGLMRDPRIGEKDGKYFQAIDYEEGAKRDKAHVLHAFGYVADIDGGNWSEADIRAAFDGWACVAYTTFSSLPNERRWRVFLPFQVPANAGLYEAVHDHHFKPLLGDDLGDESRKIAQLWYLPAAPLGRAEDHIAVALDGEIFDPRDYLETVGAEPDGPGSYDPIDNPVIQAWNDAHPLPAVLRKHGYVLIRKGRKADQYQHPDSSSGSAGAWLYHNTGTVYAHSGGDPLRGAQRDSFDVMRILDFAQDWNRAFRHAEAVTGVSEEPVGAEQPDSPYPPLVMMRDFMAENFPPREPLLGPISTAQLVLVAGASGAGKTMLCTRWTHCLSQKQDFGFWEAHKAVRVLHIDGEMAPADLQQRFRMQCHSEADVGVLSAVHLSDAYQHINHINIATVEGQRLVDHYVQEFNPQVIQLDNLMSLAYVAGVSVSSDEFWTAVIPMLRRWRGHGRTVVVWDHTNSAGDVFGTKTKGWQADLVLNLALPAGHEAEDGCHFEARFSKVRGVHGELVRPFEAKYESPGVQGTVVQMPKWVVTPLIDERLEEVLDLHRKGWSNRKIGKEVGISHVTVSKWIKRTLEEFDG